MYLGPQWAALSHIGIDKVTERPVIHTHRFPLGALHYKDITIINTLKRCIGTVGSQAARVAVLFVVMSQISTRRFLFLMASALILESESCGI